MTDVVVPILESREAGDTYYVIERVQKLFSYRYSSYWDRKIINELKDCSKNRKKHSQEWAFAEAILNYFYDYIGISRFHVEYDSERGEFYEDIPMPNEPTGKLGSFHGCYDENGIYPQEIVLEIIDLLSAYYSYEIVPIIQNPNDNDSDTILLEKMFEFNKVEDVYFNSEEYKKYEECELLYDSKMKELEKRYGKRIFGR